MKRLLMALSFVSLCHAETTEKEPILEQAQTLVYKIKESALYFGAGTALGAVSLLSRLGEKITQSQELHLLSDLCASASEHAFHQLFLPQSVQSPFASWDANHKVLLQIAALSEKEKNLLAFLDNRWLAKSTGFYPALVKWVYPCFGVALQVHRDTDSHYARNPWNKISSTYQKRVDTWKQILPHPTHFPLLLTRPCKLQNYLPSCLAVTPEEKIEETVEKIASKIETTHSKIVLDLFKGSNWKSYETELVKKCKERNINLKKIICIETLQQEEIGGIRLLPFSTSTTEKIGRDYRQLLKWISTLGLTANRLELDRCPAVVQEAVNPLPTQFSLSKEALKNSSMNGRDSSRFKELTYHRRALPSPKEAGIAASQSFITFINSYDQAWNSNNPQKTLMVKGTLRVLQGLLAQLPDEKSDVYSSLLVHSLSQIQQQLQILAGQPHESFFDAAMHLELIHASLSAVLEICSPYNGADFPPIYQKLLTRVPERLKSWVSCAVHSSGMTSMAGIFKAIEKSLGTAPHTIYGENTYFECIHMAQKLGPATSLVEAQKEDWEQVDLIIAQFNPALKRIDLQPTEYRLEKIAEALHKTFQARKNKPVTLALDCTLDYIDSHRVGNLLEEFQPEIEAGLLNVICYRSGLKFDLFGMDNYCGAPFYMIHNTDTKWASFDDLLKDPALQTDRLSLNWFCLAYQHAAPYLELYRKQIFENTRTLLDKIPKRLFDPTSNYRMIYFEPDTDAAFLDIKIQGPYHQMKGAALVGGTLSLKCWERGHPIFYRPSLGFYHPNFTLLFSKENTTIRLTLGLDPEQVELFAECFRMINALN